MDTKNTLENTELISQTKLKPEYYIGALSLALRSDFAIPERCKIFVSVLQNVVETSEDIFNRLNIYYYNEETGEDYCDLNKIDKYGYDDKTLEMIANIFNIKRNFNLSYVSSEPESYDETIAETMKLDNFELLLYIQTFIARNVFDGSNSDLLYLYNGSSILYYDIYENSDEYKEMADGKGLEIIRNGENFHKTAINNLKIRYFPTEDSLNANIYFTNKKDFEKHPNIQEMFNAGLLTIESVGITYNKLVVETIRYGVLGDEITFDLSGDTPVVKINDDEISFTKNENIYSYTYGNSELKLDLSDKSNPKFYIGKEEKTLIYDESDSLYHSAVLKNIEVGTDLMKFYRKNDSNLTILH